MDLSGLKYLNENNQRESNKQILIKVFTPVKDAKEFLATIPSGEPEELEKVLLKQLGILDGMFNRYAKALELLLVNGCSATMPEQVESLGNLVLKCQNQSIRTARAIADIKKPRQTVFIKKQITQQLNQVIEQKLPELKQIKETKNAPLDIGSEKETEPAYQTVEALGEVNRPANNRGKREKQDERT